MPLPLLPTSLVGSYAQPDWLIDRKKLAGRFPPRVRARELWRVAPEYLVEAQDDATLLGSLIVRFRAGGAQEMCWHLFTWGGEVELLGPERLHKMMLAMIESLRGRSAACASLGG